MRINLDLAKIFYSYCIYDLETVDLWGALAASGARHGLKAVRADGSKVAQAACRSFDRTLGAKPLSGHGER